MYRRRDSFYWKARREGLASRAAFKIEELLEASPVVRPKSRVLDLGAAPGGWTQVMSRFVGPEGRVVGVDLEPLTIGLPPNAAFVRGDFRSPDVQREALGLLGGPPDAVVCDAAPKLTGIRSTDRARVEALARTALEVALGVLAPGGNFLLKLFEGIEERPLLDRIRSAFLTMRRYRPQATRKASSEYYLMALGKKP